MKTKTLLSFILIFAVTFALATTLSGGDFAYAAVTGDNVFINPVAIAVTQNKLFVADNVADGQAVILCYDVSQPQPQYAYTVKLNRHVTTIAASENGLIVVFGEEFVIYDLTGGALDTSKIAFTKTTNTNIVDVVMGKYGEEDTPYYFSDGEIKYVVDSSDKKLLPQKFSSPKALCAMDGFVYYAANGTINRFHGAEKQFADDKFNDGIAFAPNFSLEGMFGFYADGTGILAVHDKRTVYRIAEQPDGTFSATYLALTLQNGANIVDIAPTSGGVYLLDDTNKIYFYAQQADKTFALDASITIGSDTLTADIPTEFTSFTLCKSTGYPTNIIYKTKDESTSISDIEKYYIGEFVILDYENSDQNPYYYVLVNGKFGWVKKSDNATAATNDEKILIVDNSVSRDVNFVAKFNSLNTVYVYKLPLESSEHSDVFDQKATALTVANVLQKFQSTGNTTWYYISYQVGEQTKFGFVPQGSISQFVASTVSEDSPAIIGTKKINASLFSAESLYLTAERLPGAEISNQNGVIKLYSGQLVNVIKIEGNSALLQVLYGDGTADYGWINADRLIGVDGITTNSIVGLVSLGAALLLAIILIAVFVHRKKVMRAQKGQI